MLNKKDLKIKEVKLDMLCKLFEWANETVESVVEDLDKNLIKELNKDENNDFKTI